MLNALRQNANSWFMILLFAIITVVFIFTFGSWGGGNVSGKLPTAATVNGHIISQAQFSAEYGNTFRNMQRYRQNYGPAEAKAEGLRTQVLDRLVGVELLAQEAEGRGMTVSDEEVVARIKSIFFRNSEFNRETYANIARSYNTTEVLFEKQQRRLMLAERMEKLVQHSQNVSPVEVKEAFELSENKINLKVLRIDPGFFKDIVISEAEAKKWADGNEEKITAHYNNFINRYRKKREVRARHILIKVSPDAAEADKKAARAKIDAALARVKKGDDFATVATEVSEDASKDKGGDLGFFAHDRMVKPFADAAFAMKTGDISDVVESQFGLHVIKVEGDKPEEIKEVADVRLVIAEELAAKDIQGERTQAWAKSAIAQLAGGAEMEAIKLEGFNGSLTERGENFKAPRIEITGEFARGASNIPRIGISKPAVEKAFTLTKEAPLLKEPVEVSGRTNVFTLIERTTADPEKFADAKAGIKQELLASRTNAVVKAFIDDLKARAEVVEDSSLLAGGF